MLILDKDCLHKLFFDPYFYFPILLLIATAIKGLFCLRGVRKMDEAKMKEINIKVKHDNKDTEFTIRDILYALEHVFGLNTNFEIEEINFADKSGE